MLAPVCALFHVALCVGASVTFVPVVISGDIAWRLLHRTELVGCNTPGQPAGSWHGKHSVDCRRCGVAACDRNAAATVGHCLGMQALVESCAQRCQLARPSLQLFAGWPMHRCYYFGWPPSWCLTLLCCGSEYLRRHGRYDQCLPCWRLGMPMVPVAFRHLFTIQRKFLG